jgi:TRAP-type mannitol/chloroaromatic compound transport system permease small subunit
MTALLRRLDRCLGAVYTAAGYLAAIFLVLIALLVLANIVSRMLSMYIPGLTAYSGYAMAASSFLALAYTFRHREHIRVELLLVNLSGRARWVAELWCLSVSSILTAFLATYLVRQVWFSWVFRERSEGPDATLLWIPQSLAMTGAIILAICVVHELVRTIASRRLQPADPTTGPPA